MKEDVTLGSWVGDRDMGNRGIGNVGNRGIGVQGMWRCWGWGLGALGLWQLLLGTWGAVL